MSKSFESSLPSDISLLLRADAEHCWLHREVLPVLRQVETAEQLPEEQLPAALAYLEAMWSEAMVRARETDAVRDPCSPADELDGLSGPASRYHAEVRALRGIVARRITPFVELGAGFGEHDGEPSGDGLRVTDKRSDGCAPRAA